MELGTGTTDANMDEWLEVSLDMPPIFLQQVWCRRLSYNMTSMCFALQGTAFAKEKAKKNK